MPAPVVDILMYHSISEAAGPTSISPAAFRMQMAAIAGAGVPVISLDDLMKGKVPDHAVILTFDDGFQDFADVAWPIMQGHGFRPIVYLPTAHVGRRDSWAEGHVAPRPLMGWPVIGQLAAEGVQFGSHSVSHVDLDRLDADALEAELTRSRAEIEHRLGKRVLHFAPPYGAAGPDVRRRIAQHYKTSVSVVLDRAAPGGDLFQLPRLEMYYFTDPGHWQRHLAGKGTPYLLARKALRRVRQALRA